MPMKFTQFIFVGALLLLSASPYISADTYDNDIQDGIGREPRFDDIFGDDDYVLDPSNTEVEGRVPIEEPAIKVAVAPCLGCPTEIDPKNEKVNSLAQFAFSEYMSSDDGESGQKKTLVRVKKAQSQVVAGVKYILDLEIGWTNCSKQQEVADEDLCQYDKSKPTFACVFHVVEKSWLDSKEVVHSECNRDRDQSTANNANDAVNESYDYDSLDDDVIPMPPTEDASATTTRIKRDASNNNLGQKKDVTEGKGVIEDIANFALGELDRIDEDNNARLLVEVLSAKKQTVSGWLYHLKLQVAPSTCPENSQATLETCKDKVVLPFVICDVKVLLQPWQTVQKKLVHGECQPMNLKQSKKIAKHLFGEPITDNAIHKKRSKLGGPKEVLIGGRTEIDPESGELSELVDFAIDSVDASSNALHAQKLVRVVYADRQLVSGILTNMVIEVGYTTCRKKPTLDKTKCDIDETRDHQYCNVTIHEKPWLNERTVKDAKCGKIEEMTRVKRSTLSMFELEPEHEQFGEFMEKHNKVYESDEEYAIRYGIFKDNMRKVKLLQENEQGTATYGATTFADLTEEEFTKRHLGLRVDLKQRMKRKHAKVQVPTRLPEEFDWRHYNIVTPVKNQGMCGSCWAFSVTGNIEGLYALKHSQLQSFSEQELVDCDTMDEGCNGGLPENAYKALEKLGGLETENEYPYEGKNDKCHFAQKLAKAQVTGFVELPKNETEMAAWLVKNGPISIGINANAMQFYFGGVSHPWKFLCSPKNLDHGVLIVGYGVHTYPMFNATLPFWVIKNSWGESFGEQGYYRVYRGENTCGVAEMATSAVVA